jgi:hypothetical protein
LCPRLLGACPLVPHVQSILKNNLDRIPARAKQPAAGPPVDHENIRGGD